jgi:hypothetical protein
MDFLTYFYFIGNHIKPRSEMPRCIKLKILYLARHWELMPVILASWEAKIGRMKGEGQPTQIVLETHFPPSPK